MRSRNELPLLGQSGLWSYLITCLQRDRVPHASLFWGERGLGAVRLAIHWTNALLCESDNSAMKPCGDCNGCRKVQSGNHPDFFHVRPEGKSIKIEQTKKIQQWLTLAPIEASYRIVLIEQAELMTAEAANSLLKWIEEPPQKAIVHLATEQIDQILPTIRSRCQSLRLSTPTADELAEMLAHKYNLSTYAAHELAHMVNGNPGQALRYLDEDFTSLRQEIAESYESIQSMPDDKLLQLSEAWAEEHERALFILDMLEWHVYKANRSNTWHIRQIEEARTQMMLKANRRLVFDVLLLRLKAGKA